MRLFVALAVAALTLSAGVTAQKELARLDISPRTYVTLRAEKIPLSDVLHTLAQQVKVEIRLAPEVDGTKPITVIFTRAEFADAFELVMNQQKLTYTVVDSKTILVKPLAAP